MNQVNGLFMSLLALIIVRGDQIFNVCCLNTLDMEKMSNKATVGFVAY